jgi:flavin reductase (DIM6/NTAB) family NADH-FMN oxidoreductase RutF
MYANTEVGAITPVTHAGDDEIRRFRRVAGCLPSGVTVLSTVVDDVPHVMTANSFITVSLDPVMVAVSLGRRSRMNGLLALGSLLSVTVLAQDQDHVSQWFADRGRPAGRAGLLPFTWVTGPVTGCPVLRDGVAFFDATVAAQVSAGDHVIVLARVLAFGELGDDRQPLLFWKGRYARPWALLSAPGGGGVSETTTSPAC